MILSRYHALRDMTEEGIEVDTAFRVYREMAEGLLPRISPQGQAAAANIIAGLIGHENKRSVVGKAILGEDFVPLNPARRDRCR